MRILEDLNSPHDRKRKAAEAKVVSFVDDVMSTELIPNGFNRNCNGKVRREKQSCPNCKAKTLNYPSPQELRNLRHRIGAQQYGSKFATCSSCNQFFGGNELAYKRVLDSSQWTLSEGQRKARIKQGVLSACLQNPTTPYNDCTVGKINELYNHHLDHHTKTCFKKGEECRAYLPELHENETTVLRSEDTYEGFSWKGDPLDLTTITVRPRRLPQDAYTNCYSKHISNSRAPSNSNLSVTTGARSCIYATCYTSKPTQKEDTDELKRMMSYVGHRFLEERRDSALFEGISRLMGAAIVATSEHVVSAPMAAYLVRNQSRFKCSHRFKYVPVRELIEVLSNTSSNPNIGMTVMEHDTGCFLTNDSLHYMYRPNTLEDICLFDFSKQYETVRTPKPDDTDPADGTHEIDNCDHPGHGKQLCRERSIKVKAQFSHWIFPDVASFGGNIWTLNYPVNASVEKYCQAVLILFHPFRQRTDLTTNGSYFKKFRTLYRGSVPQRIRNILTNVQMFYNSMRMPPKDDPLFKTTTAYNPPKTCDDCTKEEEEDDGNFFDGMFDVLQHSTNQPPSPQQSNGVKGYDLTAIRKDGARGCGFYDLPKQVKFTSESQDPFLVHGTTTTSTSTQQNQNVQTTRDIPNPHQLMTLVYSNQRRRVSAAISENRTTDFVADGTALSIMEWSQKPQINLDKDQQKAFQIATASFILTYYDDAQNVHPSAYRDHCPNPAQLRHDFNLERRKLQNLTRLQLNEPLRMFLDGPGGAGKSRVLTELLAYALQYTTNLNLKFDMRTIIVSAISGVAAVSVGGETTHKVAYLNKAIPDNDVTWANARLLIIDEVSFMSTHEVETLDEKLRTLMRNHNSLFGGINVIFAGDFRQLEPCRGRPLYSKSHYDKKWLHSINSYVELKGMWRFKDDPEWGRILSRIRNDTHTLHDIDAINQCTLEERQKRGEEIPSQVSYCVYANRDRSAINAALFSKALHAKSMETSSVPEDFLIIRASDMVRKHKSGKTTPFTTPDARFIYENCSDSRVRTKQK